MRDEKPPARLSLSLADVVSDLADFVRVLQGRDDEVDSIGSFVLEASWVALGRIAFFRPPLDLNRI